MDMEKLMEKSHRLRAWALQSGFISDPKKREKFKVVSCKKGKSTQLGKRVDLLCCQSYGKLRLRRIWAMFILRGKFKEKI